MNSTAINYGSPEMWPRGRRHSPAKGAYEPKLVSRVRIPPSPPGYNPISFKDLRDFFLSTAYNTLFPSICPDVLNEIRLIICITYGQYPSEPVVDAELDPGD